MTNRCFAQGSLLHVDGDLIGDVFFLRHACVRTLQCMIAQVSRSPERLKLNVTMQFLATAGRSLPTYLLTYLLAAFLFLPSQQQQQQQRERELRKQHEREQRRRYEEMEQLRREEERRHAEREQVHKLLGFFREAERKKRNPK